MFEKKEKESLMEFVAAQIENAIFTKKLQPGDKFPPSREMQKMLGTSQGTLREALHVVQQKGLIEIKAGKNGGVFVKEPSSEKVFESLAMLIRFKKITIDKLAAFREAVETAAAYLAATSASKEDIRHLKGLLDDMEKFYKVGAQEWLQFYLVEERLHITLAQMTDNALFESMVEIMSRNDYFGREHLPRELENMQGALDDWRSIIDSIENGQPDRVATIMREHIWRYAGYIKEALKGSEV